jgi:peptidoglycan/LPS O-acetylase OafA/YrhL
MKGFRTDINGLRAWAVIAVVLFHFRVPGFSGGFVGVDIFFVISGFLMTGIIFQKLATDRSFSIFDFYLARSRRIVPSLLFLCLVLIIVGWFLSPSMYYKQLAKHTMSAILFFSNILFWKDSGYFDTSSDEKMLLHTWSLSVEWQFYIIFPIVLLILWRLVPNKKFLAWMIILGFITSLSLSIAASERYASASFYLLPTRAWELLLGGLVFHYGTAIKISQKKQIWLEYIGIALVIVSILTFTGEMAWPGYFAIIPVAGCSMVLIANREQSIFTGSYAAQWLGKISYSLYLWHWPLAVLLFISGHNENPVLIILVLVISVLLGWLSWRFIEDPSRVILAESRKIVQFSATAVMIIGVLIAPSYWIYNLEGVPGRISSQIDQIFAEADNINPLRSECSKLKRILDNPCTYGGESLGAIVLGDSHAMAIVRAIERALPLSNQHVLDLTLGSCPTIANIKSLTGGPECGLFIEKFISKLNEIPNNVPVLIVNRISAYIEGPNEPERAKEVFTPDSYLSEPFGSRSQIFYNELQKGIIETACRISATHSVYLIRPIPELKVNVPSTMGWSEVFGSTKRVTLARKEYAERHRIAIEAQDKAAEKCGVHILNPLPLLCDEEFCYGDVDGRPMYHDDDHLSLFGAERLKPLWKQMFEPN